MSDIMRVLIVADRNDGLRYQSYLESAGFELTSAIVNTPQKLFDRLDSGTWNIVLLDYEFDPATELDLPSLYDQLGVLIPIIVVTEGVDIKAAADYMRAGASDVVDRMSRKQLVLATVRCHQNRVNMDEQVREQASLLNQISDAIYVCNAEGTITYWNQGAAKLYELSPSQAIGANADQLCPPDKREDFANARELAWRNGEWMGQLEQVGKQNRQFTVITRCSTMLDDFGKVRSLLVVNTDVSEIRIHEEQFIRSQRLESIGTLAGGIAHDLNNVLAPIIMACFLLKSKVKDFEIRRLIDTVEGSAIRGSEIVKQVLTIAKGVEGEHNTIQPKHILRDIAQIVSETFPRKIEFKSDIPRELPTVCGDATQLQQMLLNLCLNARDAVQEKGDKIILRAEGVELDEGFVRMHVDCKIPGPYLQVSVEDNGIGIPPATLDRIFEPFFTTKRIGQGTGLGLSTALAIAKGHEGFITVETSINKGTTFSVYIPAENDGTEDKRRGDQDKTAERLIGHGELVLVIDDEEAIRDVTKKMLENSGYEVITAKNGAEGIAEYVQHRDQVRIVVTDLLMPVMDGVATIAALRKVNPSVKIIATSGFSEDSKVEAAKQTANAFMSRPFTSTKLLEKIREILLLDRYVK